VPSTAVVIAALVLVWKMICWPSTM